MLKPSECFAAPISTATGLTLVLPRSDYEVAGLIAKCGDKLIAVCLTQGRGIRQFAAFECEGYDSWKGLLIPHVEIELDETSLCQTDHISAPLGTLTRKADKLIVNGTRVGDYTGWENAVAILEGLPLCADHLTATFCRWQIVLGSGEDKRVMYRIDASPH